MLRVLTRTRSATAAAPCILSASTFPGAIRCFSSRRDFDAASIADTASSALARGAGTGLYGFDALKTPKGFRRFVEEAIERSAELVSYISQLPPSEEIIRAMDEISDTVCSVIDSAELCRNTHPDREYVDEANCAAMRMHEHIHFLNTNCNLYTAILRAQDEGVLHTAEAQRAAHALQVDFEKGGIHLPAEKLEQVNKLNVAIAQLGAKFSENIMIDPGCVDIFPASRIPSHLHHHFRPIYRLIPNGSGMSRISHEGNKEKGLRISTDSSTMSMVLKWVSDAEVRKQMYVMGNSVPRANLAVLDDLICARHELAQIMDCKSYSEFAVRSNVAASPDVVMSFLLDMSRTVRSKADKEFETVRQFKRKALNQNFADLDPWDESYFTAMMTSSEYDLDSSVIASYFSLRQCLEGLKILVESLFGATFHQISVQSGETWHPDVIKLSLHHPCEGDLGFLYLDLYARKGKYPGCAHFAVRGGRRLSETEYQLPVVALVCNFAGSSASSSCLSHSDLETLFHEFGHALHSLLSRTEYQHFSGTMHGIIVF